MSFRFRATWFRIGCALCTAALVLGCSSFRAARLYQSGTSALDRGDSKQAVVELERAAELLPEASEVQNHLGLAYQAAGRERDAEFAFRRAVALDCGNAAAVENLRVAEARARKERP
jgi:Flp pilus assembly protein TadD